jgi:hypothetical protein
VRASLIDLSNVVYDRVIDTDETETVVEALAPFVGPAVHYRIGSAFDRLRYEDGRIQATVAPLDIHYYGPEYGWRGQEYKRLGSVVFYFFNTKVFRIPDELTRDIRRTSEAGSPWPALPVISQLSRNFEAVNGLARRLIAKVNPVHLLVCTEAEVHPLTAHAIYHRDWRDYLRDFGRIASLHERGGAYFCDVAAGEPAFAEPRKESHDYGYIRRWLETQDEFIERVQALVDEVLADPERIEAVSRKQLEDCFLSVDDTEVEELNDSYYLYAGEGPFAYLEEAYFRLWAACGSASKKASSESDSRC